MKRIVTIQDISCIGKCSLTVALPIISAFEIETAVIPTAVLSQHTAFENFSFKDLTDEIPLISVEWKRSGMKFDAIYTGYMGSVHQIDLVSDLFDDFGSDSPLIIVDPAMADNGRLYTGFPDDFADSMLNLVKRADVIVPNLTEAALLLHEPYSPGEYDNKDRILKMLKKLSELGCKKVILTGISFGDDKLGAAAYDADKKDFYFYFNDRYPQNFHGTGDVFASVVTGCLVRGLTLKEATKNAVDFVKLCIDCTSKDPDARWYGVNFEQALKEIPSYISDLS